MSELCLCGHVMHSLRGSGRCLALSCKCQHWTAEPPKPPACAVCGNDGRGIKCCMCPLASKPSPACHCPVGSVVEGCPCGRFVSAAMAWVAAVERPAPEAAAIHAANCSVYVKGRPHVDVCRVAEAAAIHGAQPYVTAEVCERIATLEAQIAALTRERDEARGMALTEVTDLLRNVLSRSLVSATEKLIVEVILDKIEALKAGAK